MDFKDIISEEEMVAIILVNYNGYNDTVECVKSILQSNYCNYKIIIVENGSKDLPRISKDKFLNENCHVIISTINCGFSRGNNIGIRYAIEQYNAKYIMLLNNDTIIKPNTLYCLVDLMKRNSKVGIATCQINTFDNKNIVWFNGGKFNFDTGIADMPGLGMFDDENEIIDKDITFASGCLMMVPQSIINEIGLLDENYFMYAEDTDYCCRILISGYRILFTNRTKIFHKVSASAGKNSKTQQYYMFRNNCYIIKKYGNKPWYGYLRLFYRQRRRLIKGNCSIVSLVRAWNDFRKGIMGKVDIM